MASANESIKLIIRTTNNKYADFLLELPPLITVYDLKQKITLNHPTRPVPTDQRLIFSGKLLDDSSLLSQVFVKSSSGSSFMVHLVLDSDKTATTPKSSHLTTVRAAPIATEPPPSSDKSSSCSHSNTYEQYSEELFRYQQQLQGFLINPCGTQPDLNFESQAYLQYCYTHYQMYQNLLAYQRTVIPPSTTTTTTTTTATPTSTQQSSTNETSAPAPPAAAPAPQPAAGNNDLEQENDLLGVLNMLVELFVLCSIIYFYSTFSRFLVVFVIFVLLYLHCRGYLSIHRRRRVQVPPAPVVPEQPAANDGEQVGEAEAEPEVAVNEAQNLNDAERQRPVPPAPGPVEENPVTTTRLLLTALSTFFSSLVPERPQRA
ncbi:unnamed protein product [Rotaria socialis]|uniref:Ubiquitin-like domain-containing protein n=1 Tax=Rotaria socialis TaxID=392032 RepID=A0A818XN70_9BILA|nr:unnamed protein product [Rotaria socialis]CAF3217005.1 unnamed protein product [Rotaria socialis]CAF3741502.1 unnamed protein product [Rotaria socialis]CAF3787572.1 unnamed protein product [Rotaria socialis]CAF4125826.1 unnamed protein product [Rotaria socialis]